MGRPTWLDKDAIPNASLTEEGRVASMKSNPEAPRIKNKPTPPPTLDDIHTLRDHILRFLNKSRARYNIAWKDEDDFLPSFSGLADALRPLRSIPEQAVDWPHRIWRALPIIAKEFDAVTRSWGWERVAEPEPSRSAYVAERRTWFALEVERPLYEAARSWQAGYRDLDLPSDVDQWADEGRKLGFNPILTQEEGQARYPSALTRWYETPRFGTGFSEIEGDAYNRFCVAFNQLDSALKLLPTGPSMTPKAIATPHANQPDWPPSEDAIEVVASRIEPEANGTRPKESSTDGGDGDSGKARDRKRVKKPSQADFNTYRLVKSLGKQGLAAKAANITQGEVSKRCGIVNLWLKDGNALPAK